MKFVITLFFSLLFSAPDSFAVVKRHDTPSEKYELAEAPKYLIDMPHEGHGVLIAPRWIITVAHIIFYDYEGEKIKIGNKEYLISKVIIHSGYSKPDKSLFDGDANPLMHFLKNRDDIALIKLSSNVEDIDPIKLYEDTDERNKTITVFGRGTTGNGLIGEVAETKPLRVLNIFQNTIEESDARWLSYKFDKPPHALELEGMHGSGDSGGPSVIFKDGTPYLAGLSSWQFWKGDISSFKGGLYGTIAYQVRISSYNKWVRYTLQNN